MDNLLLAKTIIADSLKIAVEEVLDDSELTDVGQIDSLAFESIVTGVERHLGEAVDSVKLIELRTVKDLAKLLSAKKPKPQ